MKAKIVTFRIKPDKKVEVIRLFNEFIVPGAKKLKGFNGGLLLTDPDTGQAKSIAFWEREEDIMASETSGYYREWVNRLSNLLVTQPVRELYDVSNLVNLSFDETEAAASLTAEERR
jgi:quinol monooxygenase YgiN